MIFKRKIIITKNKIINSKIKTIQMINNQNSNNNFINIKIV